jgi:alcohol dehydrogenase class IV
MTELNLKFDYRPHPVSRVCYGKGRLEELGNLLRSLEGKRALLVTSPSIKQAGLVDRAEKILGHDLAGIFDQTLPHSPIESVQKAVDLSKGCGADAVISLGGGSCVDTAKGVVHFRLQEQGNRLPHIAIPTTLSGAEFTMAAGITHGSIKKVVRGPHMTASLVLLDPEAFAITPPPLVFPSGLNAMHHCIEGVSSVTANSISDAMLLHAIRLLRTALPEIKRDPSDLDARGKALTGAALAAMGIFGVSMGIGHAMAHAIGGRYKTPHATTHAIVSVPAMRFNHKTVLRAQVAIAEALGVSREGEPAQVALEGIERLSRLRTELGIPPGLASLGVSKTEFRDLAQAVMNDVCFPTNPRPATLEDVMGVLEMAL